MFNAVELFKQRLTDHFKLLNRYLRYIFNGHFMIALIFIIITLAIYYQRWLENIGENFPSSIVIALALGFAVSYNPLQLFLKEPDKVFLIVKEEKMQRYFQLAVLYNFIVQLYIVFIITAVVLPLYNEVYPNETTLDFLYIFIIILVVKAWNLFANWNVLKIHNVRVRMFDKLIRTLLSIALFYFLLVDTFVVITAVLYFAAIVNNIIISRKQAGLAWDVLIENDQNRLASFYRFVSMFADAPQLTKRVKKRRILSSLIHQIVPFKHSSTYDYLYRLTFIRSNDYLHMYIRLIVIGGVVIFFVPNNWLKVVFALLFIYMANFQMITLFFHYRTSIWLDIYPLNKQKKETTFIKWLVQLTFVQTIIFALLFLVWLDLAGLVLTLAGGSLFNYLFNYGFVKRKIEGM
ncbi:MAG TPA: ABC transporter permease [Pseudogracilibacillus sp.]|nr:ABC transporter permease [Pseudogracilibacillus sp.]